MSAVLLASLFILAGQNATTHVHQNSQCGYTFEYPNGWQIVKNPDYITSNCTASLRPVDYERRMANDDVDVYTLTVWPLASLWCLLLISGPSAQSSKQIMRCVLFPVGPLRAMLIFPPLPHSERG
jgi:hypothetical protein